VAANDQNYGVQPVTDLEIGYQLGRSTRFALGTQNLFDPIRPSSSGPIR
jgi:hypothetical protein